MKVQLINTYTNKYSSNRVARTDSANLNFGKGVEILPVNAETAKHLGKIQFEGVLDVLKLCMDGCSSLAQKARMLMQNGKRLAGYANISKPEALDRLSPKLSLTVTEHPDLGYMTTIKEAGNDEFVGFKQSLNKDGSEAVKETVIGAFEDWLERRLVQTAHSGRRKPPILLEVNAN